MAIELIHPSNTVIVNSVATDANLVLQTKGTGALNLAPGSSGVNISNGTTVTAITGTAAGTGYTSIPSVVISAPTTAGGVQATATAQMQFGGNNPTVVSGGTGYTAGDVLTVVGGTGTAATITVSTVSGGVITAAAYATGGTYSVLPTLPVSVTGGTGSNATFNGTFAVRTTAYTITNAGSGYVEQPTITFSGGGGSGAAAYATVGGTSIIKSVGSTSGLSMAFQGPRGFNILQLDGSVASTVAETLLIQPTQFGRTNIVAGGSANSQMWLSANGTGFINFSTNGTSLTTQARIAHTASAVNYLQVTGAATGGAPVISPQGSDTNISLTLQRKGTGQVFIASPTNLGTNGANFITVFGAGSGSTPSFSVAGADTNIDLSLTPKGTGKVNVTSDLAVAGGLTVTGDLTINGTTTTINATTITVDDKNIELGSVASPTDITADGGGITLKGTTDKTISWIGSTGHWTSNINLSAPALVSTVATGTAPLTVTSTTRVNNLNVATAGTADTLTTARTIGGVSFNGSANIDLPGVNTTGNQNTSGTASNVTGTVAVANGGTGQTSYTNGQLLIGNTTGNTLTKATLTAGSGISITNGNGSITIATTGGGVGAVNSVTATSPVLSSGGTDPVISLASGYGDTQNPYASKTANNFLAAPNGTAGAPTFRAIVAADIPTLNQNTTGSAATLTTTRTLWGQNFNGSANVTGDLIPVGIVGEPSNSFGGFSSQLLVRDNRAVSTGLGGAIGFGNGTLGTGGIAAYSEDGTQKSYLALYNRDSSGNIVERFRIVSGGNVGIGTQTPGYKLEVNGSFAATSKSFLIPHPTKEGKKLRHGSLEGPEHGVYVRGKINGTVIELPEYWTKLVDSDSITVQLTAIGKGQKLYVEDIRDNKVYIGNDGVFSGVPNCFYLIQAERVDIEKMDAEID
jgi:hypothetical protein